VEAEGQAVAQCHNPSVEETRMGKDKNQANVDVNGFSILDALSQLRTDIAKLQAEIMEKGLQPAFEIYEGELELKLVAKSDKHGEVGGKAKWRWVVFSADVEAKGGGSTSSEHLQTLRIKFRATGGGSKHVGAGQIGFPETKSTQTTGPVFENKGTVTG
jgi:hypothetical protein